MIRNRQVGEPSAAAVLAELVPQVTYKHWRFTLTELDRGQGCQGLTLVIEAEVPDSFGNGQITFAHLMPVPPAAYDRATWVRWLLDQVLLVERHESLELFTVDGDRPYFPEHGPGRDPYAIAEIKSRDQAYAAATPWSGGPASDPHFTA